MQPERLPQEQEQVRKKNKAVQKPGRQLSIRPSERVAPAGVIGFLAVALAAALVLYSMIQLNSLNTQIVQAQNQLSALQTSQEDYEAQYSQTFNMQEIENDMLNSGRMIKPGSSQQYYLEISEDDSVTTYGSEGGLLASLGDKLQGLIEYFS